MQLLFLLYARMVQLEVNINIFMKQYIVWEIYLFVCLPIYLYIYLYTYLAIYLPTFLPTYLPNYLLTFSIFSTI